MKPNSILSHLGYQGPNILLLSIILMLSYQHYTQPYIFGAVFAWQIVSHLLNVVIKNTLKAPRPDSANDPNFAIVQPTLSNYLTIHRKYGMPSGHAQAVCSEFVFIALFFQKPWLTAAAGLQTLLTLWQRYAYKRHTLKQLTVGGALGLVLGYGFYRILLYRIL
jgi:membrane-associated phospholipid phosphatase